MRHKFQQVLNKIHDFLNGYDQPDQTETNSLTATIEEAIQKQTAVHLILSETSFTGDIIKYDQQGQQIIVKNFSKNIKGKDIVPHLFRIYTLRKSLQTTSTSPCRTQVQPAASFLVCSLIFIEY
ncbi:DNA or RNA helicases of superfamily II [Streptococcus pneumoniae]|nr:DNA or RNA helicases of superfamily II [Streptococcus pneumoniae]